MLLLKRKKTVSMRLENIFVPWLLLLLLFFENKKTTEMSVVEREKEKQSITLSGSTSSSSSTLRKKDTFAYFVQNNFTLYWSAAAHIKLWSSPGNVGVFPISAGFKQLTGEQDVCRQTRRSVELIGCVVRKISACYLCYRNTQARRQVEDFLI